MNYRTISDDELVMKVKEDESASNIIYQKYKYIIDMLIKKYTKFALDVGLDIIDLKQEALLGLSIAINQYQNDKYSLKKFIYTCIERRLIKAIKIAGSNKNKVLNEALSFEYLYKYTEKKLEEYISDNNENNPLKQLVDKEKAINLKNRRLSYFEQSVLYLLANGLNNKQIAHILKKDNKAIHNTIQRLKIKVQNIVFT